MNRKNILIFIVVAFNLNSCKEKSLIFEDLRLEKQVLCQTLEDPMEIAVANDGKVFVIERKGKIKLFNPITKLTKLIGKIEVDLGHEDGLLGLTIDPNFDENGFLYLLYTPKPHQKQRVSRFVFDGNKLSLNSETTIIEYPIVPERHQGGSLAFDNVGNLYISTGENTIPTGINGYAPIDERVGFEKSDAQRSAGNTADLRGKILRIKPLKDGGYEIPAGNFKEKYNLKLAKPEIYIMGCRNPFRIAIDKTNNTLFWGEIGPDAGSDSEKGPRGHDEINRASEAGFYGWPYFIGNNKAYSYVDFNSGLVKSVFDTLNPKNLSPNNTGDIDLPKPKKPLLWYPYDESKEFPELEKGGRSAMAGMVYHRNLHKLNESMLHEYFEGKLFIMDWMRNWIKVISFDKNGNLKSIQPFMPQSVFNRPMDMQLGNDGCMYLLEYGTNWFGNTNGTLSKIVYNRKNRSPKIALSHSATEGGLPYSIKFSTTGTYDPDGDSLAFNWSYINLNNPSKKYDVGHEKNPTLAFENAGKYEIELEVVDSKNVKQSKSISISVGNEKPNVKLNITGNQYFYWANRNITFSSLASDKEDGTNLSPTTTIDAVHNENINSELDYNSVFKRGKFLVQNSDCKSCHARNDKSVGPSFWQISQKYNNSDENVAMLAQKVIQGGTGVWGNSPMSAHPQLSADQTSLMIKYILAHKNIQNLPVLKQSNYSFQLDNAIIGDENIFIKLKSSYADKGANGMPTASHTDSLILKNSVVNAINYSNSGDIIETNGLARLPFPNSFISFKNIDLTQVKAIDLEYNYDFHVENCWVEIRIDSPKGKLIGKSEMKKLNAGAKFGFDNIKLEEINQKKELFIVYNPALNLHAPINIKSLTFKFN